jgi:ATP-dependent helicase HepA
MSRKKGNSSLEDPEYEQPPEVWAKGFQTTHGAGNGADALAIGQRWASDMEPELGIGTLTRIDSKRVTLSFQDGSCIREYSLASAPLRRIRFRRGDTVRKRTGDSAVIESLDEKSNLITYHTTGRDIIETDLSDFIRFSAPLDRLLGGHTDSIKDFRLRGRALDLRHRIGKSAVRGFCGARIDLIPHQLYIAGECASRHVRRILLADEVGLGKTIEACLILHRLLACGRASRALICVPQSIVHVWFVELLRKFNLVFRIIDKEYFDGVSADGKNPFLFDPLVLCDTGFLSSDDLAAHQAAESGWDVCIIDEAHHLCEGSPLFESVRMLTEHSRDVFFLTATPQQHGEASHFGRLKLLDPSRYSDFDSFLREATDHSAIAALTSRLLDGKVIDNKDIEMLRNLFKNNGGVIEERLKTLQTDPVAARRQIVAELLDRFGIGRAMFRNTRQVVGGFPKRQVCILPLTGSKACLENLQSEQKNISGNVVLPVSDDPRFACLTGLLREFANDKFLLICRSKETVHAIEKAVLRHINVNIAQFHEGLSLIQRDRNAAWFGEEEGARILLCSEIGSEGRNFQFCHHLFMWDIPADCELIEQRIGRLDRIGQKQDVTIHVPFISNSPGEVLCRWFHEAVGIFNAPVPAAQEVFETQSEEIVRLMDKAAKPDQSWRQELDVCIGKSKLLAAEVAARLEKGRDRLLEQHSFRFKEAAALVEQINKSDQDRELEQFMTDLFKFHGVFSEPLEKRTYKLWSESSLDESFPALRTSRPLVTFDRARALAREDIEFMTPDHPAVQSGLDMLLGSEKGNSCCALGTFGKESGLLLDAVYVVECIAPPGLYVERFLSPTPVRIIVDHTMQNRSGFYQKPDFENSLQETNDFSFLADTAVKTTLLPEMLNHALSFAQETVRRIIKEATGEMHRIVGSELDRITALAMVNPHIRQEEIHALRDEIIKLDSAISGAAPRLDSIRLIWNRN